MKLRNHVVTMEAPSLEALAEKINDQLGTPLFTEEEQMFYQDILAVQYDCVVAQHCVKYEALVLYQMVLTKEKDTDES